MLLQYVTIFYMYILLYYMYKDLAMLTVILVVNE